MAKFRPPSLPNQTREQFAKHVFKYITASRTVDESIKQVNGELQANGLEPLTSAEESELRNSKATKRTQKNVSLKASKSNSKLTENWLPVLSSTTDALEITETFRPLTQVATRFDGEVRQKEQILVHLQGELSALRMKQQAAKEVQVLAEQIIALCAVLTIPTMRSIAQAELDRLLAKYSEIQTQQANSTVKSQD